MVTTTAATGDYGRCPSQRRANRPNDIPLACSCRKICISWRGRGFGFNYRTYEFSKARARANKHDHNALCRHTPTNTRSRYACLIHPRCPLDTFRSVWRQRLATIESTTTLPEMIPATHARYQQLCIGLRHMGHLIERRPGNIASQLRGSSHNAPTFCT